jgi:hypothetical protein
VLGGIEGKDMAYEKIRVPSDGKKITMGKDGRLNVPDIRSCRSSKAMGLALI